MDIHSKLTSIDIVCAETEQSLTSRSIIPGVGTACGIAKVVMGTFQMVTGLVLTILLTIPLIFIRRDIIKWSASHIVHGLINVLTGAVEAMPLIGSIVVYVHKYLSKKEAKNASVHLLLENPKLTWIGYENVYVFLTREYTFNPPTKLLPYLLKI